MVLVIFVNIKMYLLQIRGRHDPRFVPMGDLSDFAGIWNFPNSDSHSLGAHHLWPVEHIYLLIWADERH